MSKILLISHIFPPAIDGGSRVIYKIGQYLESQNHQTLYLSSNCSSTDDFTKKTKIPRLMKEGDRGRLRIPVYHHLRRPLKFISLFLPKNSYLYSLLKVFQKGPIFKFIPFLIATTKIIKFQPDLIIAGPLPTTTILYARFFKKITNLYKYIVSFPSILQGRGLRGGFCRLLINSSFHQTDQDFFQKPLIKTLQQADYLWTLTQYETDYFIKNFKINPQKIILAGNGIDQNFLIKNTTKIPHLACPPKWRVKEGVMGRLNILFIGSLSAHKGVDILIKSFSEIYHLRSNILLTIAGQKTLFYPEIQKIIKQQPKEVQSKIKIVFNFPQKRLTRLIDDCNFLVLPSSQESFGLVLTESWARNKPVITSDIPPLKELIKKTNGGLIFKNKNSSDLTQKISKLINSPKLCYQLGQNGFNYVKNNYTWSTVGKNIFQKIELK